MNPYSYILNNPLAGVDPTGYEAACDGNTGTTCAKQEKAKDIQAKDVKRIHIDKATGKVTVVKKDGSTVEVGQFVKRGISAGATVISGSRDVISGGAWKGVFKPDNTDASQTASQGQRSQQESRTASEVVGSGAKSDSLSEAPEGSAIPPNLSEEEFKTLVEKQGKSLLREFLRMGERAAKERGDDKTARQARAALRSLKNVRVVYVPEDYVDVTTGKTVEAQTDTIFSITEDGTLVFDSAVITFYRASYMAYKLGSPADRQAGYSIDLKPGSHALIGLLVHESAHLLPEVQAIKINGKWKENTLREQMAESFLHRLLPGEY